jgi:hypothetical protein
MAGKGRLVEGGGGGGGFGGIIAEVSILALILREVLT